MSTIRIQNTEGRFFTVKIVRKGDAYGLDHCLTHDGDDALVEFYDATYADDDRFDDEGQFVSRYYASTLLGESQWSNRSRGQGLCLDGGVPVWTIDGAAMQVAEAFVRANR